MGSVLSTGGGWGTAWSKPGRKNEAGEMLLEAVKPPQPAKGRRRAGRVISRRTFQFNLTEPNYSLRDAVSNIKFAGAEGL